MLSLFEQGLKPGPAPVGYLNSYQKGKPMYPDPKRKHYIKECFELWNTGGYSIGEISELLYSKGFRSVNEKKVGKSAVAGILKRIEYAGGLSYDGNVKEQAQHDAIISLKDFRKAQKMFEVRNNGADRSRKHVTLLSGMAHCFKCGSLMYGEYHETQNYYACKKCGSPYAKMDYVEDSIREFFRGSAFTAQGLTTLKKVLFEIKEENGNSVPQQKAALKSRKSSLDKRMSKIEDKLWFDDNIEKLEKDRLEGKYKPLKEEMNQINEQLKELNKPSKNLKDSEIERVVEGMGRMGDIYEVLNKKQKKQFLKFFIRKAYVDCEESRIVNYELVPEFKTLLSRDLVRISSNWLPGLDSNQQPFA
ncbi:hypothetical protein GF360_00940 [candidate division WWE3 bacterium]|nr:hypothetical protein [candidate division WWE3 bacterium]